MVPAADIRVLVVDDDELVRSFVREGLERLGFARVLEARDPVEALPVAREQRVDLIVCDYEMPAMNGLDLARHVRREPSLARTGFVTISARRDPQLAMEARAADADAFISKPFTVPELAAGLDAVFHTLTSDHIDLTR